jgi:hypothetical protein
MDTIACKWRTERPAHDVHSYEEFLQLARLHRDGPRGEFMLQGYCYFLLIFLQLAPLPSPIVASQSDSPTS